MMEGFAKTLILLICLHLTLCESQPAPINALPCSYRGLMYPHQGEIRLDECKTCFCNNSIVKCDVMTCPPTLCEQPIRVPNECCDRCTDSPPKKLPCSYGGKILPHRGEIRVDECTTCSCDNSIVKCDIMACPPALCDQPIRVPNECCDRCPDSPINTLPCIFMGNTMQHKEQIRFDECKTCSCDNTTVRCDIINCPALDCDQPIKDPNECCDRCPESSSNKLPCSYRGELLPHRGELRIDECTKCSCDDSVVKCVITNCPPLDCDQPIKDPNECCDRCPESSSSKLPCSYRGQALSHEEEIRVNECTTCLCDNSTVYCDIIGCPPTSCDQPIKDRNECCDRCPDEVFNIYDHLPCSYRGEIYLDGNAWAPSFDPCFQCVCENTTVKCDILSCPTLHCTNPVFEDGVCCPKCPSDEFNMYDHLPCSYRGEIYSDGTEWNSGSDPCFPCVCKNSTAKCQILSCPILPCKNPVFTDGVCCPKCPLDVFGMYDHLPCSYRGEIYSDGTEWNSGSDPCFPCVCKNSTAKCQILSCPILSCKNPVFTDGVCCPKCPLAPTSPLSCSYRGQVIQHNEQIRVDECTTCLCDNTTVKCDIMSCPPLYCDGTISNPNECCDRCTYLPMGQCSFRGQLIPHQGQIRVNRCTTCSCDNSTVTCDIMRCPPTICDNLITDPSQCCGLCPYFVPVYDTRLSKSRFPNIRENSRTDFTFNVKVKINRMGQGVEGEGLWKLSAWASAKQDGSGERIGYVDQILTPSQASIDLQRSRLSGGFSFTIPSIRYTLDATAATCVELTYLCVEFHKGDYPVLSNPHLPFNVEGVVSKKNDSPNPNSLRACAPFEYCN